MAFDVTVWMKTKSSRNLSHHPYINQKLNNVQFGRKRAKENLCKNWEVKWHPEPAKTIFLFLFCAKTLTIKWKHLFRKIAIWLCFSKNCLLIPIFCSNNIVGEKICSHHSLLCQCFDSLAIPSNFRICPSMPLPH